MYSTNAVYLMTLLLVSALPAKGQVDTSPLNLTPTLGQRVGSLKCTTPNNETGTCVASNNCNNAHELLIGGDIADSELRSSKECSDGEWCCTENKIINKFSLTHATTTATTGTISPDLHQHSGRRVGSLKCTTPNKETGTCVASNNCNYAHELQLGGDIADSELRSSKECSDGEWCCTENKIINKFSLTDATTTATTVKKCLASNNQNDCPWCVKLYRSGKDRFNSASGFYCLGAMIGSRTILTTATCVLSAQSQVLWVRVPNSANPNANYTVVSSLKHPKYNSGTRINDFALLSTQRDIEWASNYPNGACFDTESVAEGDCMVANIDVDDNIALSPVIVTRGSCFAGGNVADAMCAHGLLLDSLLSGAPLMCLKNNLYIMMGLTKISYGDDSTKALLGSLEYNWLTKSLKGEMGLSDGDFLFKLNY